MLRIVDWTAEKVGNAPTVPSWELNDPNQVLLDKHFEPAMVEKRPSAVIVYRLSGTYIYGFKNPSQAKLHYGRPPWMSSDVECVVSDSQFSSGIIDCESEGGSENQPSNPGEVGSFPPE